MKRALLGALMIGAATMSGAAAAQPTAAIAQSISGTRLDVSATGDATRVPDVAIVNAGVVTRAASARAALEQNAARMERVRNALRRAGIADRDIQTSNIGLHPDYRHAENQPPALIGYQATNEVTIRFRDIAQTGRILDALVAQGANQINGPMLEIDRPEAALDEARQAALVNARARAELYARSLGMSIRRVLSVSEAGAPAMPYMRQMAVGRAASMDVANIEPGEQRLSVALTVSYELQ